MIKIRMVQMVAFHDSTLNQARKFRVTPVLHKHYQPDKHARKVNQKLHRDTEASVPRQELGYQCPKNPKEPQNIP